MAVSTKAAIGVGVCVAILGLTALWKLEAASHFERALQSANESEMIVIAGKRYIVSDGAIASDTKISPWTRERVLALAYEKLLAERNPILTLAGTDPESLDQAADALATSSAALARLQATQSERQSVESALYPTHTLHALAALERARLAFIASGRDDDARAYQGALSTALRTYQHDIRAFTDAFSAAVPSSAPAYATERGTVTRAFAEDALAALSNAVQYTQWRAAERSLCTFGFVGWCTDTDLRLPSAMVSSSDAAFTDAASRTIAIYSAAGSFTSDTPLVALSMSDCVRSDKAPLYEVSSSTDPLERVYFVGDLRFVRTADHASVPLYSALSQKGVMYAPSQPSSYYECPGGASDWARAMATINVARFAHSQRVSQFAHGDTAADLARLEKALANDRVTERDAASYLTIAQTLPVASIPALARDELTELSVSLADRSAGLDMFAASVAAGEMLNIERGSQGLLRANDAATLFYTRSAFLSLFLGENRSLINAGIEPPVKTTDRAQEPFVWLSSMSTAMDSTLVHSVARFRTLSEL